MKQTVNFYEFRKAFEDLRLNDFTYEGLQALYDYLEQYEEDTNCEVELDVNAICCDYTQSTINEALEYYDLDSLEDLEMNTLVISVNEEEIIYLNY